MEKSYGHKVDKYALIYCAADEISTYLRDINDRPTKYMDFYMKHIDKSATFIRFMESIFIISGTEILKRLDMERLWDAAVHNWKVFDDGNDIYIGGASLEYRIVDADTRKRMIETVEKYQKECAEKKFATLTAPF